MKVLSDKQVKAFLNADLSKKSLLNTYHPIMLKLLHDFKNTPESVPPRTVRSSNTIPSLTHLFMPCNAPDNAGIKLITGGPTNTEKGLGLVGATLIVDAATGLMEGLVNAKNLTAFRTALATSVGMVRAIDPNRKDLEQIMLPSIASFGVGLQSYWHIKLALTLYPGHIKTVKVVNRSLGGAENLAQELSKEYPEIDFKAYSWQGDLDGEVISSDCSIIFGCTPSTESIILEKFINKDEQYKTFIGLIGSYKPHMIELDLQFIIDNYKNDERKPKFIVDSSEHTLAEAGELIQSGLGEDQVLELTELKDIPDEEITTTKGNITVSKVVGLSLMDIAFGKHILQNSENGTFIEDF
ncbi:uncharacterized protein CLIB1423_02S06700 [[Candida] railenensis]|uniref:Ornithine cyclodeaminase n=1 Tax=[Candida] railenensis TaxID=45579 RepID=A0A9P0QKK5_9ASCO|nr:uncharacterized protein CLIB1423_02S06700 [[Candida] railenensis]